MADEKDRESLPEDEEKPISGDADDTGGEDEDEPGPVPYDRFSKVAKERREAQNQLEQWGELDMSPAEAARAMKRLETLERMEEKAEAKGEALTPDQEAEKVAIEKIRKEMYKVFPALERIDVIDEAMGQYFEGLATEAWHSTESLLQDLGDESPSDADIRSMSEILVDIVGKDRRLRAKYNLGHIKEALDGAHKKLTKRFGKGEELDPELVKAGKKVQAKRKLKTLPKTHDRAGAADTGGADEREGPKNWREAGESAMKRLEKAGF